MLWPRVKALSFRGAVALLAWQADLADVLRDAAAKLNALKEVVGKGKAGDSSASKADMATLKVCVVVRQPTVSRL